MRPRPRRPRGRREKVQRTAWASGSPAAEPRFPRHLHRVLRGRGGLSPARSAGCACPQRHRPAAAASAPGHGRGLHGAERRQRHHRLREGYGHLRASPPPGPRARAGAPPARRPCARPGGRAAGGGARLEGAASPLHRADNTEAQAAKPRKELAECAALIRPAKREVRCPMPDPSAGQHRVACRAPRRPPCPVLDSSYRQPGIAPTRGRITNPGTSRRSVFDIDDVATPGTSLRT